MRQAILGILALFVTAMIAPASAVACGDKNIDMSRGVRFQRANAVRPATVLLQLGSVSDAKSLNRLKSNLVRVGHEVEVAGDAPTLQQMLRLKAYDLVIVPIQEAASLAALLTTTDTQSLVIPMVSGRESSDLERARTAYPFVLTLPGRAKDQILIISAAISSR